MTMTIDETHTETIVINIIAQQAMIDPATLSPKTRLADLALDSLMMVEIIFDLEEAFDIAIPFNANANAQAFDFSTIARIAQQIDAI